VAKRSTTCFRSDSAGIPSQRRFESERSRFFHCKWLETRIHPRTAARQTFWGGGQQQSIIPGSWALLQQSTSCHDMLRKSQIRYWLLLSDIDSNHRFPDTMPRCQALVSQAAQRSAIKIVGRLVFAAGMVGMMEASTTQSPSTPYTFPCGSTTARLSARGPMRQVPTG